MLDDASGVLFIVSSPSGGGKTTLIQRTMERLGIHGRPLHFSVSHTTRAPRSNEQNGRDYFFVDRATFESMQRANAFLEWAEYAGNLYGTSRSEVEGRLERGIDVFLDIEVQGAMQVRSSIPDAVKVFVYPPSYEELKRRLVARRQDDPETIQRRLSWALDEFRRAGDFDYVIINDRLDEAVECLYAVCLSEHQRQKRMQHRVDAIRDAFQQGLEEDRSR